MKPHLWASDCRRFEERCLLLFQGTLVKDRKNRILDYTVVTSNIEDCKKVMLLLLTGYYLRNQNRKIKITCGKNVRRKKLWKRGLRIPRKEEGILESQENDPKKTGLRGWRNILKDEDTWKLILKGGQGPTWTVEPVEKQKMLLLL